MAIDTWRRALHPPRYDLWPPRWLRVHHRWEGSVGSSPSVAHVLLHAARAPAPPPPSHSGAMGVAVFPLSGFGKVVLQSRFFSWQSLCDGGLFDARRSGACRSRGAARFVPRDGRACAPSRGRERGLSPSVAHTCVLLHAARAPVPRSLVLGLGGGGGLFAFIAEWLGDGLFDMSCAFLASPRWTHACTIVGKGVRFLPPITRAADATRVPFPSRPRARARRRCRFSALLTGYAGYNGGQCRVYLVTMGVTSWDACEFASQLGVRDPDPGNWPYLPASYFVQPSSTGAVLSVPAPACKDAAGASLVRRSG